RAALEIYEEQQPNEIIFNLAVKYLSSEFIIGAKNILSAANNSTIDHEGLVKARHKETGTRYCYWKRYSESHHIISIGSPTIYSRKH
ncbi:hypothetical protein SNEBB_011480, partial [Seison nebaliae]